MLTERGWAALGAAVALFLLWLALGEFELLAVAVLLGGATATAWTWARIARPSVTATRRLSPNLVHEGDHAVVQVALANRGRWALTNPVLEDAVVGLGSARFVAARIPRAANTTATYQIQCRPRGVYRVGPASLSVTDPMRLTRSGGSTGGTDQLIVYPAIEDLEGFPMVRGRDPSQQAARPEFSHSGGEDFFTIREYRHGDDLRRVHWPTSAKQDRLMIKQLETPWQSRALVLFDARSDRYTSPAGFEKGVRGAASIVRHLYGAGFDADLWAGGTAVGGGDGGSYARAMETLALVQPLDDLDIRAAAVRLQRTGMGGALVIVTGIPDQDLFAAQQMMANEYRTSLLLTVSETPSTASAQFQRAGAVTVSIRPDEMWAPAWLAATTRSWSTATAG